MSLYDIEAATPIGAALGKVRAIAVTSTQGRHDLSALAELSAAINRGALIRLRADGNDVFYAFNLADAGTIDNTNTTAGNATQCDVIPAGDFVDVRCPRMVDSATKNDIYASWLIVKTASGLTATLRISVSSENPIMGH